MDSMRNLNKSLPKSPKRHKSSKPEDLLQSFKQAALSVTNLFKKAAADQFAARQAGYQDAVYDLLSFLDKNNLGLDDGEGWQVRQWATERQDGDRPAQSESTSEDEQEAEKPAETIVSDEPAERAPISSLQPDSRSASPIIADNVAQPVSAPPAHVGFPVEPAIFTFRSLHPYPENAPSQNRESTEGQQPAVQTQPNRSGVPSRPSRGTHKHGASGARHARTASSRALGTGAGAKRKANFSDFFDIGNIGEGRDGTTGHKRSR